MYNDTSECPSFLGSFSTKFPEKKVSRSVKKHDSGNIVPSILIPTTLIFGPPKNSFRGCIFYLLIREKVFFSYGVSILRFFVLFYFPPSEKVARGTI